MGTISRQTTWATGDTLTDSDLNGEFDNILSTANGSLNADNLGVTAGQAAASKAVVLDSNKDFADTSGSNQIRNLTISGSLKIGTTFLPDASGGADLGSTSLEWGDVYIADDKKIYLGSDQNVTLQYDETTNDALEIAAAVEGAALGIVLKSDQGDDAGDEWKLNVADGGTLTLGNDIASAGSYVTHLTLTPHATVSSSTLAVAGALTVAGTAGITGVATVGGLTIGSAVINEAELETIDGITAGTVAASKAAVVDSNKDIGTFRNITINGTFSDGNYTFDTSGNVSGLGTIGSGAITSSGVITGTGFTIGSAVINEAELETIDGVTAGTVAASKAVVVDSNKDAASFRNLTLTGELDAATLDISGNADIDGTTNLDAVDIDGAVQIDATLTVGVDDQGYDVKFFGDTASAYLLWDTSADKLLTAGGAVIDIVKDKLLIGGTAVTTTAAELNVLDAVTAGTVSASLGVVVDSNKDIGSFRNVTLTGELDAGSLDVSGDADIDGTLEADAITLGGTALGSLYSPIAGSSSITTTGTVTSGTWSGVIDGSCTMTVGSDATGDMYYRDASGHLERVGVGSDGQVLTSTGTVPNWEAAGGGGSSVAADDITIGDGAVSLATTSGNITIDAQANDADVIIKVDDGGTSRTAVTFDGSENAVANFYADINVPGEVQTTGIGYTDGDNAITIADGGGTTFSNTLTVGANTDGHDVKLFGASAGAFLLYDESADTLEVRGPSADATTSTGKLKLTTALTDINDGDVLGRIDFAAPLEAGGTDAILAGAAIWAEADATFTSSVNSTELVFATNSSAAATEQMRLQSNGTLKLGTAAQTAGAIPMIEMGVAGTTNALITTPASMYLNIDSDNNETDRAFYFGHNANTVSATNLMVIAESGDVMIGTTDHTNKGRFGVVNSVAEYTAAFWNSNGSSPYGLNLHFSGAAPDNSTTNHFLHCHDNAADRLRIWSDGDVANHDGTYGTLSSEARLKQDITDARSYWDDFKQLRYKKFRMIADVEANPDAPYRLGLIADEAYEIFPQCTPAHKDMESRNVAVLDEDGNATYEQTEKRDADGNVELDADGNAVMVDKVDDDGNPIPITESKIVDLGTTTKGIKNSIIEGPIMGRVVQELQARLEAAETKIVALEAA